MRKNNDLDRSVKEVKSTEERYNRIARTHTKEQIQGFAKDMEKAIAKEKKKIEKYGAGTMKGYEASNRVSAFEKQLKDFNQIMKRYK